MKKIREGSYIVLIVIAITLSSLLSFSYPNPGHPASSIGPGTFSQGNYEFPNNLTVNDSLYLRDINGNQKLVLTTLSNTWSQLLINQIGSPSGSLKMDIGDTLNIGPPYYTTISFNQNPGGVITTSNQYATGGRATLKVSGNIVTGPSTSSPFTMPILNVGGTINPDVNNPNITYAGILINPSLGENVSKFIAINSSYGNISLNNGALVVSNGSVVTPFLCLGGDCKSSWPSSAAQSGWNDTGSVVELVDSNDNVNANTLYVDNSNKRVGIGTSSTSYKLDVNGSIHSSGNLIVSGSGSNIFHGSSAFGGGTTVLYINTINNRVGILTTNPDYTLDVSGPARVGTLYVKPTNTYEIYFPSNNNKVNIYSESSSDALYINTGGGPIYLGNSNGATTLTVKGGKIGINNANPSTALSVVGDVNISGDLLVDSVNVSSLCLNGDCKSSWPSSAAQSGWNDTGSVVELVDSNDNVDANTLYVDNANGRVGIGTSSPDYTLDVNGDIHSSGSIYQGSNQVIDTILAGSGVQVSGSGGSRSIAVKLQGGSGLVVDSAGLSLNRSCFSGQVLKWDGSSWSCSDDDSGLGSESDTLQSVTDRGSTTTNAVVIDSDGNEVTTIGGGLNVDSNTLYVDSGNNRVGIGTSSPSYTLDIIGSVRINDSGELSIRQPNGELVLGTQYNGGTFIFGAAPGRYLNPERTIFIGPFSGAYTSTSDVNRSILIGYNAGANGMDKGGTIIGYIAGYQNNARGLTSIGYGSGQSNTGNYSTFIGYYSGISNTGNYALGLGYKALQSSSAPYSIALGYSSGIYSSSNGLIAIGYQSGYNASGDYVISIGRASNMHSTGLYTNSIGYYSGYQNIGSYNNFLGHYAGYLNTGGTSIGIGYRALYNNSGSNVIAIGYDAGKDNTLSGVFILKQASVNSVPLLFGDLVNGRLGINMDSSPSYTLDVSGDIHSSGSIYQGSNQVIDTVTAGNGLTGGGTGSSVSLSVGAGTGIIVDTDSVSINSTWLSNNYIDEGQTAGGDLSGTYPNPSVAKIQGYGVSSTAPSTNQALVWDGSQWAPTNVDLSSSNELQNVWTTISVPSGSNPIPDSTTDTLTFSAGAGISITGDSTTDTITITNTGDTDASDDLTTSTTFGGDVSGSYNDLQLNVDVVGDSELNYSQVTLSDFTNDAGFITSESDTLQSVTDRGSTTTNAVVIDSDGNEVTTIGGDLNVASNTLFVDESLGRVGIGTPSPIQPLDVNGKARFKDAIYVDDNTLGAYAYFDANSGHRAGIYFKNSSVLYWSIVKETVNNDALTFNAYNSTGSYVGTPLTLTRGDSSSNIRVGINMTNPSYTLDVRGNARIQSSLNVDSGTLYVDSVHNRVGINTTSPTAGLEVIGGPRWTAQSWKKAIRIGNNGNAIEFASTSKLFGVGASGDKLYYFYTSSETTDNDAYYYMMADSNGNVGIGISTYYISSATLYVNKANRRVGILTSSPSYPLDVNGKARFKDAIYVDDNTLGAYAYFDANSGHRAGIYFKNSSVLYWSIVKETVNNDALTFNAYNSTGSYVGTPLTLTRGDSSSNIRVGINMTNPSYTLDVSGQARVQSTLYVKPTNGYEIRFPSTGNAINIYSEDTSNPLYINTAGGNINLGTSNGASTLSVTSDSIKLQKSLDFSSTDTAGNIYQDTNNDLVINATSGGDVIIIIG